MTREDAIGVIKGTMPTFWKETKEAIQTLIPELAESEDEKIRKEILDFIQLCLSRTDFGSRSIALRKEDAEMFEKWIAYLEKHKDCCGKTLIRDSGESACSYMERCLTPEMRKVWYEACAEIKEKQKEQKQSEMEKEYVRTLHSLIADFLRGKQEIDREYYQKIWDWLDNRHIEQKPDIEICPHSIKSKSYSEQKSESCDQDTNVEKVIEDVIRVYGKTQGEWVGGYDVDTLIVNLRRAFNKKEQKREWKPLEESMEALLLAIEGKWDAIKPTGYMSRRLEDLYDGLVNTFNIRETYLPKTNYTEKDIEELKTLKSKIDASMEQKPAEWSDSFEENIRNLLHDKLTWHSEDGSMSSTTLIDDKTLKDIISGIWFYVGKEALKYPNKELNTTEWSEEQMDALGRAGKNEYLSAKQFDILVSLYEQLKKLM